MGIWEEYCLICGGPLTNKFTYIIYTEEEEEIEKKVTKKEYNWMNQLYLLTNENKMLKTTYNAYELSGNFEIKSKEYITTPFLYKESRVENYGIVCHQDCYTLIQKKLKYDIGFANVCRLLSKYNSILKPSSKYKPMDKYIQQFYEYAQIVENYPWLLLSPLVNKQNQDRVLRIWTPLVARFIKTPPRASPCESATDFDQGIIKRGYDNNDWIVKIYNGVKKWVLYDEERDHDLVMRAEKKVPMRQSRRKSKRVSRRRRSRK